MTVSFFFAMAWKSALISALALLLTLALRSRAAAERTLLLRISICLLLLLPLAAILIPSIPLKAAAVASELPPLLLGHPAAAMQAGVAAAMTSPTIWDDPSPLVLLLYLGGLAMVAGRLAAGLWTLNRWTRQAEPVLRSEWTEALDRLRDERTANARLLVSSEAESPLSWGWRRPVILIDRDSYSMPEEADSILAHELAHVGRGDWLTLVLARAAVALFWFNPLVWQIERIVMEDAEQAADRDAIGRVEPARYAQTLLNYAALGRGNPLPANSIASGSLARRVKAILEGNLANAPRTSARTVLAIGATVLTAAPLGAVQLVAPAPCPVASSSLSGVGYAKAEAEAAPLRTDPSPVVLAAAPLPPAAQVVSAVAIAASAAVGTEAVAPPAPPRAPELSAVPAAPQPPLPPSPPVAPLPPAPPQPPAAIAWNGDWVSFGAQLANSTAGMARVSLLSETDARRWNKNFEKMIEAQTRMAEKAAERAQKVAGRRIVIGMEQGARGLESGAAAMERGAANMEEQARRLHSDPTYRAQRIAEAAARGDRLTDEELLSVADGLAEGAEQMRDGAREMRDNAAEMRRGDTES